jgi:hypothetical protein
MAAGVRPWMPFPTPLLAVVSLVVPVVVFALLLPIMDTGAGIDFGGPGAYALGAAFASASAGAAYGGILAYRRGRLLRWRVAGIVGAVLGVAVAVISVLLLWLFRPS